MLTEFIDQLQADGELKHYGRKYLKQTRPVSVATLKRVIASFPRVSHQKHQGNACLYKAILINAHFGKNASRPGYIEIDYVEHNKCEKPDKERFLVLFSRFNEHFP